MAGAATGRRAGPERCRADRRRTGPPGALAGDRRGSAAVDFAILGPALVVLVISILEAAMLMLSQTLLQAAVSDAARTGIIGEGDGGVSRDEAIRQAAERVGGSLLKPAHLTLETLVYPSFDSVGKPEPFTDINGNGRHDGGEPFTDVNGNGTWDADMGRLGLGGPNDIVLYRALYAWQPMTPLLRGLLPNGGSLQLSASHAVRNEPFPED